MSLTMRRLSPLDDYRVNRAKGMLDALAYLDVRFEPIPVIGRDLRISCKRKPNKWLARLAAIKLRFF
jgi:hypothetical protein